MSSQTKSVEEKPIAPVEAKKAPAIKKAKKAVKTAPTGEKTPSYQEMVKQAVVETKSRTGSSLITVKKFVIEKFPVDAVKAPARILKAVNKLVAAGELVPAAPAGRKGAHSYRIAPPEKGVKKAGLVPSNAVKPKVSKPKTAKKELVAEAPGWRTRRPEVLVTPAVEEEARRLTPPNQLDMAEVVEKPGLEEQPVEVLPVEQAPEEQPAGFLQPLVPGRRARGPRTSRLVVDEVMQLPAGIRAGIRAGQIRESLQDGWWRSLATRDQPRPVSLEGREGLGELLGAQFRAARARARTWDWEAAAQVVEEQEDVQEQQEVSEPAGGPEELPKSAKADKAAPKKTAKKAGATKKPAAPKKSAKKTTAKKTSVKKAAKTTKKAAA